MTNNTEIITQTSSLKNSLSENFSQLKEIGRFLFPLNKTELSLFIILFLIYLSYSLLFLFNSYIVDDPNHSFDIIFAFDNCVMFHKGSPGIETHPLLRIFMYPLLLAGVFAASLFGYKAAGVVIVTAFTMLVSMGVVYVYRYMKEIVGLPTIPLWILTCMYAGFFTNMILCFIVESYSISICLLAFTVFCYSHYLKKKEKIKILSLVTFTAILGGVTVTNGLKSLFPYLFTDGKFGYKFKRSFCVGLFFTIATILGLGFYYGHEVLIRLIEFRLKYTDTEMNTLVSSTYENIIDLFLGIPIFSSQPLLSHYNEGRFAVIGATENSPSFPVIIQDFYRYAWQYIWAAIFYICILIAIIKNYKNNFMHLLLSFLAIDVFVHIIIGYGIGEAFIFGGHWLFLIPLILAWGYKNVKYKTPYIATICMLGATMLLNNIIRLTETYQIAIKYFPPNIPW